MGGVIKWHLESSTEGNVFNCMTFYISDKLRDNKSLSHALEVLLLRKIGQEFIMIKDILKGPVVNQVTLERLRPKSPKITPIIIRNVYETYVYWKYLSTKQNKEYYANAYMYEESLMTQDYIYDDFGKAVPFNLVNTCAAEFQVVKEEWDRRTTAAQRRERGSSYPKWYSLNDGPTSFAQMNKLLGLQDHHKKIYNFCSKVNHGMGLSNEFLRDTENAKTLVAAVHHINPIYEEYLFFISAKLISMINNDVYTTYKTFVEGLEEYYNVIRSQMKS